jgi:hypothetical protein
MAMKWPTKRWDVVTLIAGIFTVGYILAVLITQPDWKPGWGVNWPDWVRDITNASLAVAITILSIRYGGILTDFYSKLTGFGISEVREDRRGADSESTDRWIGRIRGSKEILIVGTLSRGWFVVAYDNLDDLLAGNDKTRLNVALLDPFGKIWRSKIESHQDDYKKFLHEANQVFWNLRELMKKHGNRVSVQLYDSEPISCVIARGAIYLGLYLPRTSRKTIPEVTISSGSFLGSKVSESITRIEAAAPPVKAETLEEYRNIMLRHSNTTKEEFWSDPDVFCDFCKEQRAIPSEISRLYPKLIDGSRIVFENEHFFIAPTLGPLVDDHALIVTRRHLTSSAKVQKAGMVQLNEITAKLLANAETQNKSHLLFEHGVPSDGGGYGGCGICHCHIHSLLIPADYNPIEKLKTFLDEKNCKFESKNLTAWEEIGELAEKSYLCIQVGKTPPVVFIFKSGERVESQLMRQFLAKDCPGARKQWNWRKGEEIKLPVSTDQSNQPKEAPGEMEKEKERLKMEEKGIRESSARLRKIFT